MRTRIKRIRHGVQAVAVGAAVGGLEAAETLHYGDQPELAGVIATVLAWAIAELRHREQHRPG